MVTVNYQAYGSGVFKLRLRLYLNGETRYVSVSKLLKGDIKFRHWDQSKQMFKPSCPYGSENNDIITQFRQRFDELAIDWQGSLGGFMLAVEEAVRKGPASPTLPEFMRMVIEEKAKRKHADGTQKGTYEVYEKLARRLEDYCKHRKITYETLHVVDITPAFVEGMFDWIATVKKGSGKGYISKMLHSVIMMADKRGLLKGDDFKGCGWESKRGESVNKSRTLTEEQCRQFATMKIEGELVCRWGELYRDFCVFLLYTGQSPCDAIALKYSDMQVINGINHFVFKRRKISEKQTVPCCVPINAELERIMKKWRRLSRDGYVFPIRTKEKLREQTTNNGDIKHFVCRLNLWLKKAGKVLKCGFPLHTYTFRHTAITHYISKGVPVIYVANMMGTSVENCEKIYYNNMADISSRNKVLSAMIV